MTMEPFVKHTGLVAPLDAVNVDTDQIIPKQFLKRVERSGYGDVLFFDARYLNDGKTPNPDFELNGARYRGASILLTRDNFGCGSSREHAPWALKDYGFRCIVAPSFADIFFNNCFNNGILPVVLSPEEVERLFVELRARDGYTLAIDLPAQTLTTPEAGVLGFDIDPFLKQRLIEGVDQIGLTLKHEKEIAAFEKAREAQSRSR